VRPTALTLQLDVAADMVRSTDPAELPLGGKVWTLRIEDDSVLVRIKLGPKKINDEPYPRLPRKDPNQQPNPPSYPRPEPDKPADDDPKDAAGASPSASVSDGASSPEPPGPGLESANHLEGER